MRNILLLIFALNIQFAYSQKSECELFNEGIEYYQQEKLDSAIMLWRNVVEAYPDTSICYSKSFNNIPIVYGNMGETALAKEWYEKVLASTLNDRDEGENIMEPYANYKYWSCLRMADLFKKENNLDESFRYVKLAETKFPYQTFSATSFEKRAVSEAFYKAGLHAQNGDNKEELFTLLEKILDRDVFFRMPNAASFTNLDFYAGLVKEVLPMIEEQYYDYSNFKKEFSAAIKKLTVEDVTIGRDNEPAKLATFVFEGKTFKIGVSNEKYNKKKFKKMLLNNRVFYEMEKTD